MDNPNRHVDSEEAIPWGIYSVRERMEHVSWYEPQGDLAEAATYHYRMQSEGKIPDPLEIARLTQGKKRILEKYILPNGIHYALILDAQTGDPVLSSDEFQDTLQTEDGCKGVLGEADIIRGTDLGDGHILQMFVTHREEEVKCIGGTDTCTSYVRKERVEGNAQHIMYYDVDPLIKTLRLGYKYIEGLRYFGINLRPHIEPDWGSGHEIIFGLNTPEGQNNGLFRLEFDQEGRLNYIHASGKRNSQPLGEVAPGISFSFEGSSESLSYSGDQLSDPGIHGVLQKIFGIDFEDPLTLNLGVSTNNMFSNIDAQKPIDPKFLLVFKNSTPLVDQSTNLPLNI